MAKKIEIIDALKDQLARFTADAKEEQIGTVLSVGDGIARMSGLSHVKSMEMLEFPGQVYGVALTWKKTAWVPSCLEIPRRLRKETR